MSDFENIANFFAYTNLLILPCYSTHSDKFIKILGI